MFFSRYQALPGNEYLEDLPPLEVRKSIDRRSPFSRTGFRAYSTRILMFFSRYQALPGNEYLEDLPPLEVRKSVFYWVGLETVPVPILLSKSAQVLGGQGKIKFSVLKERKLSGSESLPIGQF